MTQSGVFTIFDIAQILTSSVHHTDERKLRKKYEDVSLVKLKLGLMQMDALAGRDPVRSRREAGFS